MKRFITGIIAVSLLLASIACSSPDKAPSTAYPAPAPAPPAAPYSTPSVSAGKSAPPVVVQTPTRDASGQEGVVSAPADDRMIVRTGQMAALVEDVPGTLDRIASLATSYKGYVVSSNSWREGERLRGAISIRIPANDYDNIIKAVTALVNEVTQQTSSTKDVTEEYTDLGSRLKNLEATEQQLLRIMEKATKIEDVLAIQREITNTRNQIEQAKGRMLLLERTTSTSLLTVNLEQAKLEIKFNTSSGRVVQVGDPVKFAGQIVGGYLPYSYQWSFGDGDTSTELTPTHVYKSVGSYTVSLKVTDNRGNTNTETTKDYMNVIAPPGWSAGNVAQTAWNAFVTFAKVMANVLIWVAVFAPVWIVVLGILYWRMRRKKAKAKAASQVKAGP